MGRVRQGERTDLHPGEVGGTGRKVMLMFDVVCSVRQIRQAQLTHDIKEWGNHNCHRFPGAAFAVLVVSPTPSRTFSLVSDTWIPTWATRAATSRPAGRAYRTHRGGRGRGGGA
jgi:hypothetical protein